MILYFVFFYVFYFFLTRFENHMREILWSAIPRAVDKPLPLLLNGIRVQLQSLSFPNILMTAYLDWQLKIRSFRESMIFLCLSRLATVIVPGLFFLMALTLELQLSFGFLLVLYVYLKTRKIGSVLMILFQYIVMLLLFDLSMEFLRKNFLSNSEGHFWFWLSDARPLALAYFILYGFFLTAALRKPNFALLSCFAPVLLGFVPVTNILGVVLGELMAWGLLSIFWNYNLGRSSRRLFLEWGTILILTGFVSLTLLLFVRGYGELGIRVMGNIFDKKLMILGSWAIFELIVTFSLMTWGHFRFRYLEKDPSDIEIFRFSDQQLHNSYLTKGQIHNWIIASKAKLLSLKASQMELGTMYRPMFPDSLRVKSQEEVESLERFIEIASLRI